MKKEVYFLTLEALLVLIEEAVEQNELNEQWFLDWMDNLNKISVLI